MSKYFYILEQDKDSFIAEILEDDCVLESDIDMIAPNHMMVYCNVSEDYEHLAFDALNNNKTKKLIRVTFDADGY